ncbi:MAG: hypothetical protein B6D56_05780 [Candidatus Omnitrophica bacterium 4484_70.1]|nr:MAG: hypothetical protein B6D56_05780 [Candidatus Omnitrophica bacterium 4484_70.1]
MKYFYGPVYSRRLGFSLGINLFREKTCSFNCVYCQLGETKRRRKKRAFFIKEDIFKEELEKILKSKPKIDYITFSGCGEPTLHENLDKLIKIIKMRTKIPVCLITNSSLLYMKKVREELKEIDLLIPSLDAPDEKLLRKINRPVKGISFSKILEGLIRFRKEHKDKEFWLEIMLVNGFNDKEEVAYKFKEIIKKIKPTKVQLNLPLRPNPSVKIDFMPSGVLIEKFKKILGENCEVVEFRKSKKRGKVIEKEVILNSLKIRPQTIKDIAIVLKTSEKKAEYFVENLIKEKKIYKVIRNKKVFYLAK